MKKLILIITVIIMALLGLFQYLQFDSFKERVMQTFEIGMALVTIGGVIVALFQFREAVKRRQLELKILKTNKSLEMMKLFSEVLEKLSFVSYVFNDDTERCKIIGKYPHHEYVGFNLEEMNRKFEEEQIKYLNDHENFIKRNMTTMAMGYMASKNLSREDTESILRFSSFDWEYEKLEAEINKSLTNSNDHKKVRLIKSSESRLMNYLQRTIVTDFETAVSDSLNQLEYFSAFFITGIADEEIVYNSLHQVFLSVVLHFYPIIAKNNNGHKVDEYYTYTIALFQKWSKKYKEDKENEENSVIKEKLARYQPKI